MVMVSKEKPGGECSQAFPLLDASTGYYLEVDSEKARRCDTPGPLQCSLLVRMNQSGGGAI